jgi:hypothetical protein
LNRHFIVAFTVILIGIFGLASWSVGFLGHKNFAFLGLNVVFASDAYGDDINDTLVQQYNGSAWLLIIDATGNSSAKVDPNLQISFLVNVKINASLLATNTSSYAQNSATMVNMSIVQADNASNVIWNNLTLNATGTPSFSSPYWYCSKLGNWTSSFPQSGVTYNCTIVYQGYY